jgi:hypothetical protein
MRFLRRTAGYTSWDHKRNEDILTELQMSQKTEFICQYRKNWKEHVDRMSSDRIPTIILKYQRKGKRNLGRPLKTLKDSCEISSSHGGEYDVQNCLLGYTAV